MIRKIRDLSSQKLFFKLQVPDYIRQEFLQQAVKKNEFSLWIICAIIFAVELFNIARVLVWSQAGLSTLNNRIYFSMYCTLILLAVLWLVLLRPLQKLSVHSRWIAQYIMTSLLLLWHMCLNTYDLYRDPAAGTSVLTTALMGLALLIQSPSGYSTALFAVGYLLFRVMMAPLLGAGDQLNLTITFVVALAVSWAHAHHTGIMLKQQKQIVEINNKLQELVRRDPLTGLLNKMTVECRAEQMLQGLGRAGQPGGVTLFLMDMDKFKEINDCYGHPCGDHVLVEMAEAMGRAFPGAAGLGRVGGDEFAVLYDRPLTEARAMALGQGLVKRLENIQWQGQPLGIRCSVGVGICTRSQCTYQELYAQTDWMLYRAKESGRGRCCVRQLTDAESSRCEKSAI